MAAAAPDGEKIMRRIHPVSCEWLKRPKVAMSEFADTMIENVKWLNGDGKTLVDSFDMGTVSEKLQPMLQALGHLNTKNSEANPKGKHFKKVLSTLYENDHEVDNAMKNMVQLGGSMFLAGIQYLVVKELLSNPVAYANKMVGDNPDITDFKGRPLRGRSSFNAQKHLHQREGTK